MASKAPVPTDHTNAPTWDGILALLQPLDIASDVLDILKREGVADMDTLADMDTPDLLEMGICAADVSTILRAVTHRTTMEHGIGG